MLVLGRAAHCLILEGHAAFDEQFLVADGSSKILLREKLVRTHVPKKQPIFNTSILTDFVRSLGTLHPGKFHSAINAQAVGENGFFTPIFRRR